MHVIVILNWLSRTFKYDLASFPFVLCQMDWQRFEFIVESIRLVGMWQFLKLRAPLRKSDFIQVEGMKRDRERPKQLDIEQCIRLTHISLLRTHCQLQRFWTKVLLLQFLSISFLILGQDQYLVIRYFLFIINILATHQSSAQLLGDLG